MLFQGIPGVPCACRSYFGNLAGSLFIVFLLDKTLLFHGAAAPSGLANAMAVSVAKVRSSSAHLLQHANGSAPARCQALLV